PFLSGLSFSLVLAIYFIVYYINIQSVIAGVIAKYDKICKNKFSQFHIRLIISTFK
ncbi:MAG: hypothetical protein ACI9K1_002075, partial [Arcticibacterium sp.]